MDNNISVNELTKEELVELVGNLQQKLDLQENFLLNISHDLRSPINVILSILQCLKYTKTKEKNDEYKEIMKRNSYKIIKLIDNLIDTTKLEMKYFELNKKNIDIVCLVESIVESIEKYAQYKEIQLVFDTNIEECIIAADPEALDRIVMNLLSNAIKFSPNKSNIFIDIIKNNDKINISVSDDGPGIPKEEQILIFDRFKQASINKENEFKGSGIGLDLVNYLTKAHEGSVRLESEEGKGSKFTISLPIIVLNDDFNTCELFNKDKVERLEIEFSDIYL